MSENEPSNTTEALDELPLDQQFGQIQTARDRATLKSSVIAITLLQAPSGMSRLLDLQKAYIQWF